MTLTTTAQSPGRGASRAQEAARPRAGRARLPRHRLAAAGFLAPALALIALFVVVPMAMTFWISLHRWSMLTPFSTMTWVGLDNYHAVLTGSTHLTAFRNTVVYVTASAAITIPLAVLLALLLYFPKLHGRGPVRVILFATYVVPTVAIVIVWSNLYSPNYGPIDAALSAVGISSPGWLSSPHSALISLVIFNVWQMLGYYVVLLVAGLTQIPEEVYEAARIDGANAVRQTFSITLPLLRNTVVFVLLMTVINSVQVFDPVYLLTQGGPANSTNVLSFDIQRTAFQNGLAGQASAMAVSLLVVLAVVAGAVGAGLRRRA